MNKFNFFIGEPDLFFHRRGAEGTEEEKKEIVKRGNLLAANAKITSIAHCDQ
ncbi:hypothetical protein QUA03_06670 [Microcoleus sp. S36b_A4]|uniref:hypothetical protein n=1 Tax=Microcoleus sp. S36b_A4 TaxID=3055420 RepID=UPI002FD230E4